MEKSYPEIFETADVTMANQYASLRTPEGEKMYRSPEYDRDRHVYILIKKSPKKVVAQVAVPQHEKEWG